MSVFFADDIRLSICDVIQDLKNLISIENNSFLQSEKEKILLKTDIQACVNKKYENKLKKLIHKILIDYCFKAESISPGGFYLTLELISKNIVHNDSFKEELCVLCPKFEDFSSLISNETDDKSLVDLTLEAIDLAGFAGKITVEKSSNDYNSIELIEGYTFKHKPIGLSSIRLTKPKIILIDGYIESVSEINTLFEGASDTKEQILLVSRGMHDDVLNTIKVNRDRSTMFVYPIIINFDLEGINTIVDMSTVSLTNPVSCNLGELISSIKISDAIQLDEVTIIHDSIVIKNSSSKRNVSVHINNLLQKVKSSNEDIENLLICRIRSLSGINVIIRLADDSSYILKRQFIDRSLRSIRSMLDYGIVLKNDKVMLNATLQISKKLSENFLLQIKNIGATIV